MADNRIRLPSSEGGIVRYAEDESPSLFMIKPEYILIAAAVVAVVIVLVQALKLI
ncbi:MAG: preprotein translocase subunit Sec61beta [DPANN group archaeon]|nr:preprotein translocase subunit Sec61beta [DPANN group archaeon]